ncbi:MAG: universal stress protein [Acidimicrobiia bacterium]|nr:universal stress protein [Acidimicrobiia bacterium]
MVAAALERVLVGTDGSAAAARGVGWAAGLARALGAELVVTSVVDTRSFVGDLGAERSRVAVAIDEDWSEPAGDDLGSHLSTLVLEGDPRTLLPSEAVTQKADVLVLGSAGVGWYPAMHLGHVAHAVAHHSPVPVVIVPPGAAPRAPGVILLGIDGSAGSASATAWAARLAGAVGAEVVAVHVRISDGDDVDEAQCKEWVAPLLEAGVPTRIVGRTGWPATALIELVASEAPDLVILGARGAGGYKGLQLGSVSLGVLQRSFVPVAIVPV